MVPSWTETLIECGAEVVGRTRFCIHPQVEILKIPAVGGTKDFNFEALGLLEADLLLLDREENSKSMSESTGMPFHASHVRAIGDLPSELMRLTQLATRGGDLNLASQLTLIECRWQKVIESKSRKTQMTNWSDFPGVTEWLTPPPSESLRIGKTNLVYVIWRAPWMAASEGTFISSVLHTLGVGPSKVFPPPPSLPPTPKSLYPTFDFEDVPDESVVFLSSEPYPFGAKKLVTVKELEILAKRKKLAIALVDGESFSWFGLRSLRFLESALFGQNGG